MPLYCLLAVKTNNAHGGFGHLQQILSRHKAFIGFLDSAADDFLLHTSFPQDRLREQWQLFLFKNCRILYKNIKRVAGKRKAEVIIKNAPASFPFWERKLCIDENQQIPVTALLRIPPRSGTKKNYSHLFDALSRKSVHNHIFTFLTAFASSNI